MALALQVAVSGATYTGNDLLRECAATQPGGVNAGTSANIANSAYDAGSCMGFMKASRALVSGAAICIPPLVTNGQFMDLVIKFMDERPENRHMPAALVVTMAARESFPCAEK